MNTNAYRAGVLGAILLLGGCAFPQGRGEAVNTYALEAAFEPPLQLAPDGPVVRVEEIREAAGYDDARMVYVKRPHERESFARNRWVDRPGRMLAPLLVRALETSGRFRAVLPPYGGGAADLRLEVEVVRLQHEFLRAPSEVCLTVRATLSAGARPLASREFEAREAAPSDDPYGGVQAANRAARRIVEELAAFAAARPPR